MSDVHRIRLRGPWEFAPLGAETAATLEIPAQGRIHFPGSWQELNAAPGTRWLLRRRFSRPANLDSDERVRLVCERLAAEVLVRLNGQTLDDVHDDSDAGRMWDITTRLNLRNSLEIEIAAERLGGDVLPGEVYLEIGVCP